MLFVQLVLVRLLLHVPLYLVPHHLFNPYRKAYHSHLHRLWPMLVQQGVTVTVDVIICQLVGCWVFSHLPPEQTDIPVVAVQCKINTVLYPYYKGLIN